MTRCADCKEEALFTAEHVDGEVKRVCARHRPINILEWSISHGVLRGPELPLPPHTSSWRLKAMEVATRDEPIMPLPRSEPAPNISLRRPL